jgi:hypothetical protein
VTSTSAERGLGGGGNHVCLVHDSPEERMRVLQRHVADAFSAGRRVLVLAESATDQNLSDLLGRTGRGSSEGQIVLRTARDAYLRCGPFEPDATLAVLEDEKRQALADGFTGVHIVADMSWAADDACTADELIAYERAAAVVFADGTATAVCQYDRARFDNRTVATCAATHPLIETAFAHTETLTGDRVAIDVGRHGTVRVSGEVDLDNVDLLEQALAIAAERSPDVCVDASGLTFIDVRGVNALFDAAREHGIALLAARSPLRGMLETLDADRQLPGLHSA